MISLSIQQYEISHQSSFLNTSPLLSLDLSPIEQACQNSTFFTRKMLSLLYYSQLLVQQLSYFFRNMVLKYYKVLLCFQIRSKFLSINCLRYIGQKEGVLFINSYIFDIIIQQLFQYQINCMNRKVSPFRACSPLRSPIKSQQRALSPIRTSPFVRQGPLSPIKARLTLNRSRTPTKNRQNQRVQFTKSPITKTQNFETQKMQRTLKNGVGLFQQLANQNKIGSQKKQNKYSVYNTTNPFDYSQRKRQSIANYPNSFAALIQNVKEIQSIQASKGYNISNQLSFKTIQKSKHQNSNIKNEKIKNQEVLNIIQSFGSNAQQIQVLTQQKQSFKANSERKIDIPNQISLKHHQSNQQPIIKKIETQIINNVQMTSSFEDVILLIRKASEKVRDESSVTQQEVKQSFEQEHQLSFNMNPFI